MPGERPEKVTVTKFFAVRREVKATKLVRPTTSAYKDGAILYGKPGEWLVEHEPGRAEIATQAEFERRFEVLEEVVDVSVQAKGPATGEVLDGPLAGRKVEKGPDGTWRPAP